MTVLIVCKTSVGFSIVMMDLKVKFSPYSPKEQGPDKIKNFIS